MKGSSSPEISAAASLLARRIEAHLFGHILPFWCGPALDLERGGWMAWLSNDLRPDRSQPKGLVVNSRILHAFSRVVSHRPEPQFRRLADRAFDLVFHRFWDAQYGGAFWRLTDDFTVLDDAKKIYGQAFYMYALVEYYRASGLSAALERARELFALIELHAYDPRHGGYGEVLRRDWSEAADVRLSDKDMNEKKSMNNHLHVLEAYASLYRIWRDPRLAQRLRELVGLFEQRILDPRTHHFHHFFGEAWQVRSDTYTFGHDIEGSWLLCEAADALEDPDLSRRAQHLALLLAETVLQEAVDTDGGLWYEGQGGQIVDAGKECWPQAEALVGFLNAYQISGDVRYFAAAGRTWDFIEHHLADRVHGEWFWRLLPDGHPDPSLPKVSEWKGPYHGTRACLEALARLRRIQTPPAAS